MKEEGGEILNVLLFVVWLRKEGVIHLDKDSKILATFST